MNFKKKYYLYMLSMFPLLVFFGSLYFIVHKSWSAYIGISFFYLIVYAGLNFLGAIYLYKPIEKLWEINTDHPLNQEDNTELTQIRNNGISRIKNLPVLSGLWVSSIGLFYVLITVMILSLSPSLFQSDVLTGEKLSFNLIATFFPSLLFVNSIIPGLIAYFLVNDFNLELREAVYDAFQIILPASKKKIGFILAILFGLLGFYPSFMVIVDLISITNSPESYAQFMKLNPIKAILVDCFIVLINMAFSIFLITRSFTKPIDRLLEKMNQVREGDYSVQATILSDDEIGIFAGEFNRMVKGLEEREFIRDTFGKYVTPDVASVVLADKINLEGEMRVCTILVTDIAGFTTLSEKLSPADNVKMLNEYFSVIVKVIQENKGVVNKFIGDSVFALFNVPLNDPEHATNAIKAAIDIRKMTVSHKFGNGQTLSTRIGINTGLVLAGNLGAKERMEYTVIGDDVNIAARLEQLNKELNTSILVGENTYLLIKDKFDFKFVKDVQLKGKEKSTQVYTIPSVI